MRAFKYSWHGIIAACAQPAFRTELIASCVLIPLAFILKDGPIERILLIGSVLLVLIVELLNTAVETTIDRISGEWHELSKRAKDIGSAAVLISLGNAAIVWFLILCS